MGVLAISMVGSMILAVPGVVPGVDLGSVLARPSVAERVMLPLLVSDESLTQSVTMIECSGQEIFDATNCLGDGEEPEEANLHDLVNAYRAEYDLPPIPRSPSLDLLANRHVLDMAFNIGHLTHAWSNCPYDPNDKETLYCSSRAPQRIGTRYPGKAYENAHYNSRGATAASALHGWQNSPPHNALMINLNNWRDNRWQAMGLGIYKQYAVLWVGGARDPETNAIASIDPANRVAAAETPESSPRVRRSLPRIRFRFP